MTRKICSEDILKGTRKRAPEIPVIGLTANVNGDNKSVSTDEIAPPSESSTNDPNTHVDLNSSVSDKTNAKITPELSTLVLHDPVFTDRPLQLMSENDTSIGSSVSTLWNNNNRNTPCHSPGFRTKKIPIRINVPVSCRRLVELYSRLEQLNPYLGPLKPGYNEWIQQFALYRYETFWLPLAAEHKLCAGAPLDVQAIWISHMMDPLIYRQDCQRVAGRVVEHRLVSRRKLRQLTDKARGLWQRHYPKEPFDFDPNRTGYAELLEAQNPKYGRPGRVSGEVLNIARCQSHFSYQVDFLESAERRYKQFLFVRRLQCQIAHYLQPQVSDVRVDGQWVRAPDEEPTPISNPGTESRHGLYVPIDIELVWRAHLVHPKFYARDTSCLYGKMLPHPCRPFDDTMLTYLSDVHFPLTTLTQGLYTTPKATNNPTVGFTDLWKAHFPESELYRAGSCDRGVPPREHLSELNHTEIYRMATKFTNISLNSVIARFDPNLEKFAIRIRHHQHKPHQPQVSSLQPSDATPPINRAGSLVTSPIRSTHQSPQNRVTTNPAWDLTPIPYQYSHQPGTIGECICKLHPPGRIWTGSDTARPIVQFTMISGAHDQIAIDLVDKRGWLCPSNRLIGRGLLQLTSAIERFKATNPVELELTCPLQTDSCREEDGSHISQKNNPKGSARNGSTSFGDKIRPIKERVLNHLDEQVLTVRVLHNVVQRLSVVQVWSGNRLLSTGQMIGREQLPECQQKANGPRSSAKSKENGTQFGLNWQQNERAILIKDAHSDWCVLIGRWSDFKRFPDPMWSGEQNGQESDVAGTCATRGRGGHLSLRVRWLTSPESKQLFAQIPDNVNSSSIILQDTAVNIQTGEIHISKECQDVAQNVCLAFCCGLMHVLCQPRILTQEQGFKSIWDAGLLSNYPSSSSKLIQSQSAGSVHEVDPEQPSIMTTSTSFDSNNIIQLIDKPPVKGHPTADGGTKRQGIETTKLFWSLSSTISKEWEPMKTRLLRDGCPEEFTAPKGTKSTASFSPIEILGHALFSIASDSSTHPQPSELRGSSNDIVDQQNGASIYGTLDHSFRTMSSTHISTRGQLTSLNFVLCRSAGLPIDTLIPSIQLTRYIDRTNQLNTFLSGCTDEVKSGQKNGVLLMKPATNGIPPNNRNLMSTAISEERSQHARELVTLFICGDLNEAAILTFEKPLFIVLYSDR
ncbi:unnamed protein product [Echinostoma caproni]|uniref:WD_REPEATS_REGION domain-containing protein n=1 Tax=Echinostoma caproni TaxID=27848 RepID=A0A183A9T9_9TREM|nr:unnamed protein product [Echinostoma caproni]